MDPLLQSPAADGFFLCGEWEPHERSIVQWPGRGQIWGEHLPQAQAAYAGLVRAISEFEPVLVLVRAEDEAAARFACGRAGAAEFLVLPQEIGRARDTAPMFVIDGLGGVAGIGWQYDGLGGRYLHTGDEARVAGRLLEKLGLKQYDGPLVLEGGAVVADGSGTLITTEDVLLHSGRNREHTQQEIEEALALFCGARRIVWLGGGLIGEEAGGHADQIVAFAGPGRVVVSSCGDDRPLQAEALKDARAELEQARDARGRAFEIIDMPLPERGLEDAGGRLVHLSYTGFYPVNGGVLVPSFGDTRDEYARGAAGELFPGRKAVSVPVEALALAGRSLHSAVVAQPAALPLS